MRTYLISYDLAQPHLTKHVVAQAIMALGQSWARPLEATGALVVAARVSVHETPMPGPGRG